MDLITIISYICTASVGFGLAVVAAIVRLRRCTAGVVTYGKAAAVAAGLLIAANVCCVPMTLPVPIGVAMAVADVAAVAAVLLMPIRVRGSEEQSAQPADAADDVPPTVAAATDVAQRPLVIETIAEQWSRRSDKPFLKEGITLASAAEDMGVSARLLSQYINSIHRQNFNTWVNGMRVDEIKRVMESEPDVTVAQLAQRTGFTDASAMAKVFRRFTGITPRQYRSSLTANVVKP